MKKLFYLFFLFLLYSTNLTAKEPNYCVDLKKYACSPGEIKDPTGSSNISLFKTDPYSINDPQILKKSNNKINSYLNEINNESGNQYFLQILTSLFQVEQRDICTEIPYDKSCLATLSMYLVEFLASNKTEGSSYNNNPDDLLLVTTNSSFEEVSNLFVGEIKSKKYNDDRYNKIKNLQFKDSKKLLSEVIDESFDLSDSKKQALKIKINSVTFEDCSKFYGHNQKLNALLVPNAFYDGRLNSTSICNGLLQDNQSDFSTLSVLAHELAHAIDPCGITFGPKSTKFSYPEGITYDQADTEYPIPGLLTCMRDQKSVNAKVGGIKTTSITPSAGFGGPEPAPKRTEIMIEDTIEDTIEDAMGPTVEEPEADLFKTYCTDYESYSHCDHVTEAVPDWLANQVLFKHLKKIKNDKSQNWSNKDFANAITNSVRHLCQNFTSSDSFKTYFGEREHPETKRRINHLTAVHPGLRDLMGCKTKPKDAIYCDGKKAPATSNSTITPTYNQPSSKTRGVN